ncbi:unnamed protein product [Euphydryas editha]|uniref:Uncharacterized protein n=1 Tax=Euphydryas editha TaxID=104508 RepID=A0AAU9UXI8_EUPED|nr:unnamed protein product [Euphydryas editha]
MSRGYVVELREQCSKQAAPTFLPKTEEGLLKEVRASVAASVGCMIDACFAGLEERLLREKTQRPPLAASTQKPSPKTATSDGNPDVGKWTNVIKNTKKKVQSYAATFASPAPKGAYVLSTIAGIPSGSGMKIRMNSTLLKAYFTYRVPAPADARPFFSLIVKSLIRPKRIAKEGRFLSYGVCPGAFVISKIQIYWYTILLV